MAHISADDFRVPGENRAFWIATGTLIFLLLLIEGFSLALWWLPVGLITVAAIYVWISQAQKVGDGVKVSAKQFSEIHALAETAANRLSMKMPAVYIVQSPEFNAIAQGFIGKKSVSLYSALVKGMTPTELLWLLGHEFAHIKLGHTNLGVLTNAKTSVPGLSQFLNLIYQWWSRKCEYSCDRGGLLACRDEKAAISALAKIAIGPELFAEMNIDEFLKQHMDLEQDDVARLSESLISHPYTVRRMKAIVDFHDTDQFRRLAAVAP
jgi:Zn-dependent protease with chaperone function